MAGQIASHASPDGQGDAGSRAAYVSDGRAVLRFFIPGTPIGKERPRVVRRNGRTWTFTPQATENWETAIALVASSQVKRLGRGLILPFQERTIIDLWFYKHKPKSYPKRVVWFTKKPDVDNLAKCVLDGLEKAKVIQNDSIVTDLLLHKRYTSEEHPDEGVEVAIHAVL